MSVRDAVLGLQSDMAAFRHDLHSHPELMFAVTRTAAKVEAALRSFGVDEIVTGLGQSGIVAMIRGKRGDHGRVIGLRADMDALPIAEGNHHLPYRSQNDGMMHACGHDGHTAMLVGAARYLCATRDFAGGVALIFQPAEEGGGGAQAMVDDGLFERFAISEVYGMHTRPGLAVGKLRISPGPLMAAADRMVLTIKGYGGHAARPHLSCDPIVAGAAIVQAFQTIVSRSLDPMEAGVVSVTRFHAGTADNVIPDRATMTVDIRSMTNQVRDMMQAKLESIASAVSATYGTSADLQYFREYPPTINDPASAAFASEVAGLVVGAENVLTVPQPTMGAEDFAVMLQHRPGCIAWLGNGESAPLHNPDYDFDDRTLVIGAAYWVELAEAALNSTG